MSKRVNRVVVMRADKRASVWQPCARQWRPLSSLPGVALAWLGQRAGVLGLRLPRLAADARAVRCEWRARDGEGVVR